MDPASDGPSRAPDNRYRGNREGGDLTFFIKAMKRDHPGKTAIEVHDAIEKALEEMSPSRNQSRLRRLTERILRGGNPPPA